MHATRKELDRVKIFVLYLMKNINYPLDYITVNEIVMQSDYVMYLDFDEAFHQMLDGDLICENGENRSGDPLYSVTRKGAMIAEQLKSDILPSLLDRSLEYALRYLDFKRRGVTVDSKIQPVPLNNTFDVTVRLKERDTVIFSTTVNVDSEYRARQITARFYEHPEVIYRSTMGLLCGKMDYFMK